MLRIRKVGLGERWWKCLIISDNQDETWLIITIYDTFIGDLPFIITINDTSKNQPKRLDSDNTINLSRFIVNLVRQTQLETLFPRMDFDDLFPGLSVKQLEEIQEIEEHDDDKEFFMWIMYFYLDRTGCQIFVCAVCIILGVYTEGVVKSLWPRYTILFQFFCFFCVSM